jgi:Asp-tRNA(Asn)/Glu-tRNA(Gln) amidotransferase A subunit family amidase
MPAVSRQHEENAAMDRRTLLIAGMTAPAVALTTETPATAAATGGDITLLTVTEAQKLHGVSFPPAANEKLVGAMAAQLQGVKTIRAFPKPRDLQPAQRFDPRLPGKSYPAQADMQRFSPPTRTALPANDADIAFASVGELSHWIERGVLSSARITDIYLERIARLDGPLHSFITVTAEAARAEARARDAELKAGNWRGPLHGVPYTLKDVFDTAGVATTWGSSLFKDRVPSEDARIAVMLREAGAVMLGKVGMGELANGATWYGGEVHNPWNVQEPSGGSSAGSGASVAAGLCAFSIGSDSLGSILNPADRCGVVGLRPTFGRVPVHGGMPLTPSLERIGPLCRRVEDAAIVLSVINGPDPTSINAFDEGFSYDAGLDLKSLRVGYSPRWFERVGFGPEASVPVNAGCLKVLDIARSLGVDVVEVELPDLPYMDLIPAVFVEAATIWEDLSLSGDDTKLVAPWAMSWRQARLMSAIDYLQADRFRRQVMQGMDALFDKIDILMAPTYGRFDLLLATNFTGHPGLTFRCGFDQIATRSLYPLPTDPNGPKHKITANISMHGRLFEEGKMLALAGAIEKKLDVWKDRPPVG